MCPKSLAIIGLFHLCLFPKEHEASDRDVDRGLVRFLSFPIGMLPFIPSFAFLIFFHSLGLNRFTVFVMFQYWAYELLFCIRPHSTIGLNTYPRTMQWH